MAKKQRHRDLSSRQKRKRPTTHYSLLVYILIGTTIVCVTFVRWQALTEISVKNASLLIDDDGRKPSRRSEALSHAPPPTASPMKHSTKTSVSQMNMSNVRNIPRTIVSSSSQQKQAYRYPIYKIKSPAERQAVEGYMDKVISTTKKKIQYCSSSKGPVNVDIPLSCLRQTTPSLQLEYPADAEEHMNEIRLALAPWAQHTAHKMHRAKDYSGPWIENHWISHFETLYDDNNRTCVSDIFGPFIPIFVPWVDYWVKYNPKRIPKRFRYPEGLLQTLNSILRPNVPYIAVSQNDEGLSGRNELNMELIPNVLVLSAGGYGHVPVPLFKQGETLQNQKSVQDRSIFLSYVGSLKNSPQQMRANMDKDLATIGETQTTANGSSSGSSTALFYKYHYGDDWRSIMADSRFSLCPRGFGRTAYHLMETLQMGFIPIHVFLDVPWVPYADLFDEIGFVANVTGIDALVDRLQLLTVEQLEEREKRIVSLRQSHFSASGVMQQIAQFMLGQETDLRCQKLPPTRN